uniref:Uncharacterized protein n=1 Tax=Parascaris equorum TaxID=6256 RepID=A0A914RNJ1_PAREQ
MILRSRMLHCFYSSIESEISQQIDRFRLEELGEKLLQVIICTSCVLITCNLAGKESRCDKNLVDLCRHLVDLGASQQVIGSNCGRAVSFFNFLRLL